MYSFFPLPLQIYLMDIHIWYTLLSAIVGGVMGARARLGEVLICCFLHTLFPPPSSSPAFKKIFDVMQIRSLEMVHKRFESFPEAFVKNLVSSHTKRWLFLYLLFRSNFHYVIWITFLRLWLYRMPLNQQSSQVSDAFNDLYSSSPAT